METITYRVSDSAKSAYCQLFRQEIEESISQLCKSEYILHKSNGTLILNFLDRYLAIALLKNEEVIDIKGVEYNFFAPIEFIEQFYNLESPSSRLQRYLRLGESRLREEVISAFQTNKIVTITTSQEDYFLWEEHEIKLEIKDFSLSISMN